MRDSERRIISSKKDLSTILPTLRKGDVITGIIPLREGEEHILLDLIERDITVIPSATSQLASRSKTFQARILKPWMLQETTVIYNRHQLLEATTLFHRNAIERVIVKHDRKNGGIGIFLYNNIEDVYNQSGCTSMRYPFVIQPFLPNSRDIRVIILDKYQEAYSRENPDSFRNNLHCGGVAQPYALTTEMQNLCREVMERARFPYAHLDLMLSENETLFLAEINLRGGIRGAKISTTEYKSRIKDIEENLLRQL
ncbi:MAG: hypothetical protein V2I36_16580 [Desulfopila sp.]|nr:hypothetical protein [Desulfopila sp.]